jgi:hypothetical protein
MIERADSGDDNGATSSFSALNSNSGGNKRNLVQVVDDTNPDNQNSGGAKSGCC